MTLLLLLCCHWFRRGGGDELLDALAEADALYELRADPARLDEAIAAYVLLNANHPGDVRILMRLSRAFAARAETLTDEEQRKELELARAYGLECLATNQGFSSRWDFAGGRLTAVAVRELGPADAGCLATTLYAWVRWAEQRGPAAAVDLPALVLLSERAEELPTGWVAPWSAGMVELLRPGPVEHDLDASRASLQEAILAAPSRATAHADLIRWQLVLEGDLETFDTEVLGFPRNWPRDSDGEWALENRVARQRVAALAGQGSVLMEQHWVQSTKRDP